MIYGVYIQTVPEREKEAMALSKLVRASCNFTGRNIPIRIVVDEVKGGPISGYKKALREAHYDHNEGYVLVVQDDVTFPKMAMRHFLNIAGVCEEHYRNGKEKRRPLVSFFNPFKNKPHEEYKATGEPSVWKCTSDLNGQVLAVPVESIRGFLESDSRDFGSYHKGSDFRSLWYMKRIGAEAYLVTPYVIQHLGAHRSTVGHSGFVGTKERTAEIYEPNFNSDLYNWGELFDSARTFQSARWDDRIIQLFKKHNHRGVENEDIP